jgi:hypothetical protein
MSRIRTALVGTVAAGLLLMTASVASAAPVEASSSIREVTDLGGGWFSNSQVLTSVTTDVTQQSRTRTVAGDFTSQIQQPINPDGTSTWPAKRGVIPVQFKLTKSDKIEQTTDTVTDTTTVKTPRFESVCDNSDSAYSVIGKYSQIPAGTTVKDISNVQAEFNYLLGASSGGSLRWDIGTEFGDVHIYYGDSHSWTGTSGSNVNLMDATDDRFDDGNTSVAGGTFYNTKAQMLAKLGDAKVNNVSLVVDSCWNGVNQKPNIVSATVGINGVDSTTVNPLAPRTTTSHVVTPGTVWTQVSTTNPVQTNEPVAFIKVVKQATDTTPIDVIEELSSAQGDTTGQFRQIDGKYMYNLKAESLQKGSFKVYMVIGGTQVMNNPGVFELR